MPNGNDCFMTNIFIYTNELFVAGVRIDHITLSQRSIGIFVKFPKITKNGGLFNIGTLKELSLNELEVVVDYMRSFYVV
jgi:hypothetical protein